MLTYASLFSGIGGFDLGADRAGMHCVLQVEKDKNCLNVLNHHWPNVERVDDVKKAQQVTADVICGGFPCQDVSVAGRRAGLAGKQSGLWFEFHRIIASSLPRWVVIENVPGLLSSNQGQDFAVILRGLVECGYGIAWRILDAQYFGVAQRRRRVFIVGCTSVGLPAKVLFESEGGAWDSPPRRESGEESAAVSGTLSANAGGTNRPAGNANELDFCIPVAKNAISTLRARAGAEKHAADNEKLIVVARSQTSRNGRNHKDDNWVINDGISPTLHTGMGHHGWSIGDQDWGLLQPIAFDPQAQGSNGNITGALSAEAGMKQKNYVGVRRLTPVECERLQGFPEGFTDGQSDSVRYRQLGNAVCVPVAEWIFRRIVSIAT